MGRRWFTADSDSISFGSHASIDGNTAKTAAMWTRPASGTPMEIISKGNLAAVGGTGWTFQKFTTAVVNVNGALRFYQNRATVDGEWTTPNNSLAGTNLMNHVAFVYNQPEANDPDIYIDAVLQAETEVTPPTGAASSDSADNLIAGEDTLGANTYEGVMGFIVYDNTLFTAADVNRHKWWGVAPGGPSTVDVWHPMWTDSLVNKGTATADGTNAGTTMDNEFLPRVERCWGSLMGVGR